MKCPECGSENNDGAIFCKMCGTSLSPKIPSSSQKFDSELIKDSQTIKSENQPIKTNYSNNESKSSKNTLIICITVIICIAIVIGSLVYLNPDILSGSDNNQVNETSSQVDNSSNAESSKSTSSAKDSVSIQFADFYTGSSASDKSYCSANLGAHHYGETYQISVLYSRDGSNLNDGNLVKKTVDDEGFLHVSSSNAFTKYPDKAIVTIYDMNENVLDQKTYYLNPVSGSQSYN